MKRVACWLPVLLLVFAGCEKKYTYVTLDANMTTQQRSEALTERAQAYWEYRSAADYDRARDFELPYLNFIKDTQWYREFHAHDRKQYKVVLKHVDEGSSTETATVRVHIFLPHTDYGFDDKWYRVNGTWYHFYYPSILPPVIGK